MEYGINHTPNKKTVSEETVFFDLYTGINIQTKNLVMIII